MRRPMAAAATAGFFVIAPGGVAGLFPWLITRWEFREPLPYWLPARVAGGLSIGAGLAPVVHAFAQFAKAGGTPMPIAPTEHLVVSGANQYIRNPMYAGLLAVVLGQALLFGQFRLLSYAAAVWAIAAAFVRWYEEPTLVRRFGGEYEAYRRAVPAWRPRLRPWTPAERGTGTAGGGA